MIVAQFTSAWRHDGFDNNASAFTFTSKYESEAIPKTISTFHRSESVRSAGVFRGRREVKNNREVMARLKYVEDII